MADPSPHTPSASGRQGHFRQWWRRVAKNDRLRGDRAELRRASTTNLCLFVPMFHDLKERFGPADLDALAAAARVLVHVRDDAPDTKLGKALGARRAGSDFRVMRELRLRRLIQAEELEDVVRQFRRAVALLDRTANVGALGVTVYAFAGAAKAPDRRDDVARDLLLDYYGAPATDGRSANSESDRETSEP